MVRAQQWPRARAPLKPKIPVRRTVEMRPFSFDSKKSLIEGEENKTTAERGGAQRLGTFFTSFYPLSCRRRRRTRLRLSLLRVAWQKRRLKAQTWILFAPWPQRLLLGRWAEQRWFPPASAARSGGGVD